ncbi:MAG: 3-isopropylmalate dehydratase [bacterium]|jgi:3-isopropylmalate/(R)-2-methylmalate dehydratase small subunit
MSHPLVFRGRAWVLTGPDGRLISDIDTDMIFHNAHLAVTDLAEMAKYALGNLSGWKDFPQKAGQGDIVIAGANFGCGSSRQQAVDCFRSLGIAALIAESFGAIYLRNAINGGFPVGICRGLASFDPASPPVSSGDEVEADFEAGRLVNLATGAEIPGLAVWSDVQRDVHEAGGLLRMG